MKPHHATIRSMLALSAFAAVLAALLLVPFSAAITAPAPTAVLSISIAEGDDYGGILTLDASPEDRPPRCSGLLP